MKGFIIKILCTLYVILFLCGCSESEPANMREAVISNSWILYDGIGNECGTLEFSDERIILSVDINNDEMFKIDEEYVMDDSKIYVISESLGTPIFEYSLEEDTLTISYSGRSIVFKKA